MLWSLTYAAVRLLLEILIVRGHSDAKLRAEVIALRYQLRVLERQSARPRWRAADRILLAAASRILPRPAWRSLLPARRPCSAGTASSYAGSGQRVAGGLDDSHRVHIASCTHHPTGAWVVQQARNLAWRLQDRELAARFLLRDRDSKFTAAFDQVFSSEGVQVIRPPYRSPRANAFAERWVGTARRELLDHLLILGRRHLERVLVEFCRHYNQARPHQGLGQPAPCAPADLVPIAAGPVERRDRIGGLLHEYCRAA